MDAASSAAILDILREDIKDTMNRSKGKQPAGQLSDGELALQLWEEELDNYNRSLEDERLARSIARAVVDDGVAVTTARQEELRASDDHTLALELSGQPVPPPQPHDQSVAVQLSDDKIKDFINLTLADTDFDFFPPRIAGQHAEAESSRNPKRCCIAGPSDEEPLYEKEIPLSLVGGFLGLAQSQEFEEKAIEFSDPHRTYCSNPSCSKYIFPYSVSSYIGTCSHCSSRTCMRCKKPAHEGDCPDEDEELLQLAEREAVAAVLSSATRAVRNGGSVDASYGMRTDSLIEPAFSLTAAGTPLNLLSRRDQSRYSRWYSSYLNDMNATMKSSGRASRVLISARSAMIIFRTISCNVDSVGFGLVGDAG
ncbi:hypothetical protein CNMCM8980_001109 [Aspergillus fumigatiaffinis]|uniref:IBR domain-containing protein n=1 Tax=Aspergillus fumigatiaffinis TaxID=340414 RepID=A0A8H4GWL7_9EURO|nr:hypothetical protein CNMCM5878_009700 [Aspergillus fumigatiaffinis]KAF4222219.1 hypothetical protein CNMCM6457_001449 [Aspergillus fumigatiaffinis]KAF4229564.1 hypothetical protein CNMCM6805_001240 [Aspergillus fumigatiaffinis]KAF4240811.1 hypothetical protein CNMCM8980_001109 [Aspergillus fumigatiaffinis]